VKDEVAENSSGDDCDNQSQSDRENRLGYITYNYFIYA
jgi:hypothetical protein